MTKEVQGNAAVYHEREFVEIVVNGKSVLKLPWNQAEVFWKMYGSAVAKASEYANAHEMIQIQATLLKAGVPFPVVNDPAIYKEAQKEARWSGKRRVG